MLFLMAAHHESAPISLKSGAKVLTNKQLAKLFCVFYTFCVRTLNLNQFQTYLTTPFRHTVL